MRNWLGYGILLLGIFLAAERLQPPTPLSADAPSQLFSASRAFADIQHIGQRPHPVSTAEHDRVRGYIFSRLVQLGLGPSLHPGRGVLDKYPGYVTAAPVTDIVGILPGRNRGLPSLLLMSHYDSVPNSPGAADDSAGVASMLEIARALRAGPPPARDVVFLFTDGEELGLLGAESFFDSDPLARHIGPVINFETRGDSGLTTMFETGPDNDGTITAYGAGVSRPAANSLSRFIYRHMPNGTDFTLALQQGHPGINLAFIGDESAYHAPLSTPPHLDLGSVQHMGDQALAVARSFAAVMPVQHRDLVYSDILGLFLIQYVFWVGWVVFGLAAGLAACAIWKSARETSYAWGRGMAGAVLLLLFPALLLWSAGSIFDGLDHFQRLHHFDFLLAGAAAIAVGATALIVATVEQDRGFRALIALAVSAAIVACFYGLNWVAIVLAAVVALLSWFAARDSERPAALWHGALILLLLFAGVAQALAPETAFTFAWPALVAAVVAFVRTHLPRGHWAGGVLAMAAAVFIAAMTATAAAFIFMAVGVDLPAALVVLVFTAVPVLLLVPGPHRLPLWAHGAVLLAGVALFAFGRWAPPAEAHPLPSIVRYVQDLDSGKAYRVAGFSRLDAWSRAALNNPRFEPLPWSDRKQWWSPATPANVPASVLEIHRDGPRLSVTVRPAPGAYDAALQVRTTQPLTGAQLDGRRLRNAFPVHTWNDVQVHAPDAHGFSVSFAPRGPGKIELRLVTTYLAWPEKAAPLPPMPKGIMAFSTSGGTQTVVQRQIDW